MTPVLKRENILPNTRQVTPRYDMIPQVNLSTWDDVFLWDKIPKGQDYENLS